MLLAPFSRTDQSLFFPIPAADNYGPLRLPARFQQFAKSVHRLQHSRRAAVRVDGAVYPGITMIARKHPFIGKLTATHPPDHIPNGAELVILFEMHLHLHRTRPHVIGEWQRALPFARGIWP